MAIFEEAVMKKITNLKILNSTGCKCGKGEECCKKTCIPMGEDGELIDPDTFNDAWDDIVNKRVDTNQVLKYR